LLEDELIIRHVIHDRLQRPSLDTIQASGFSWSRS
jgi:hypothetical protein